MQSDTRERPNSKDRNILPAGTETETRVLSVSSLNRMAKSLLEGNFPAVIVEGEISNFAAPSSGHWYLTLKDKKSQLRCAMFVNRNRTVRFKPANGNQIIVRGKLSIYEGRGDYQLIIEAMEEAGDGALRRAFDALKAKLQAEGLFDQRYKQEILSHYQHIGIITSPTGAAVHDMLTVFGRRFPATTITLFPVSVQGEMAAEEIVNNIGLANKLRDKLGLQALIIGRGGGSLEDLQAFNEESVARAIAASDLPITSAVGHEVDFTIADFVADLRAPTPSAAAELMSPDQMEYIETLFAWQTQLQSTMRQILQLQQQSLQWLTRQLKHPGRRLQEHYQSLDRLELRLRRAHQTQLQLQKATLLQLRRSLHAHAPRAKVHRAHELTVQLWRQMQRAFSNAITSRRSRLIALSRELDAVSPLNTLARGYSITLDGNDKVLHSAADVSVGSRIKSSLHQGVIESTVTAIDRKAMIYPTKRRTK